MELFLDHTEKLQTIMKKVDQNVLLSRQEAVELLKINNHSPEFYALLSKADELSRKEYDDRGYIFAQIGINSAPCSGNCQFCSLAADNYILDADTEKTTEEIIEQAKKAVAEKADALFLMTTADYPLEKFLAVSAEVKKQLPDDMMFIANIGDFDETTARQLKATGFTGVYHIVRLDEGKTTALSIEQRIQTLDAVRAAGLDLLYCVEPIGPEHTYEQIADEMIRARNYNVDIMAAMKRVAVPGTPLYDKGEITDLELTKMVAVARLVTRPKKSMNVHEPKAMALLAGVNQLYAEIGINPRDCNSETQNSRGFSVDKVRKMLEQVNYKTK